MTKDKIEVVIRVEMWVYTGGLFEEPDGILVPTKPEEWAPTSDPGYTMPTAEEQVRKMFTSIRPGGKIGFWDWFWGYYSQNTGTVTEIISVKTLSQSYVSGE